MPIFESAIVQESSAIGTISSMIWNPGNTSTTTFGPLGTVSPTAVLKDVTVVNQGTTSVYVSSGSIASSTPTLGVQLPAGGQMTIQGYSGVGAAAGTLWAQAGGAGLTGAVAAGLASVASVV